MTQDLFERFQSDTRGISFNVGYVFHIGIAAVVLIGLMSGMGGLVESEQKSTAQQQADVISGQVTSDVVRIDQYGSSGSETAITFERELPTRIAGQQYQISLESNGGDTHVRVTVKNFDIEQTRTLSISSPVINNTINGGQSIKVQHRATGTVTIEQGE